jgi:hypothetical protein
MMALPEPVTLGGDRVHNVLFELKLTIPLNELKPETVIVELPFAPTLTDTIVGLAPIEKSGAKLT